MSYVNIDRGWCALCIAMVQRTVCLCKAYVQKLVFLM